MKLCSKYLFLDALLYDKFFPNFFMKTVEGIF